eukprot:maker-scaffold_57-snap-gene-0.1-mRNA-1 protein AED:0.47 eAED:0.53 QI:0/0/0/1/0/0/3/0/140
MEPVYSPVSNKKAIRVFLAQATAYNNKIYQVDISNAYLNASLGTKKPSPKSGQIRLELVQSYLRPNRIRKKLCRNAHGQFDFILIHVDNILISSKDSNNAIKLLKELQTVYDIKSTDHAQNFIGFKITDTETGKFVNLQG